MADGGRQSSASRRAMRNAGAGPGTAVTQTYSTTATTVPNATYAAPTIVGGSIPAGGTGAAAGGWDTAGHRDTAIATMVQTVTDVAALNTALVALAADVLELKKLINLLIDTEQAVGNLT